MLEPDTAAAVVARFLKSNNYNKTLAAFLSEAGLPESVAETRPGDWTIETILNEKHQFDKSLAFERSGGNDIIAWKLPAPSRPMKSRAFIQSNILSVSGYCKEATGEKSGLFIATSAKETFHAEPFFPYRVRKHRQDHQASPILFITPIHNGEYLLTTSMAGKLALLRSDSLQILDEVTSNFKFTVKAAYANEEDTGTWFVAAAGWDQKVNVYALKADDVFRQASGSGDVASDQKGNLFGSSVGTISLATNPVDLLFVRHPDTNELYLIISRNDSSFLYYYTVKSSGNIGQIHYSIEEHGRQNLAPHSNAWVAFTPSSLAICPTDPTLLAVATSNTPHMKLIIARLLFLSAPAPAPNTLITPASYARAELAQQNLEETALQLVASTLAPQTAYSTPQVVWRPDASGLWVNGDDGVVRGIERSSGKVITQLKSQMVRLAPNPEQSPIIPSEDNTMETNTEFVWGHQSDVKVRTLWAGYLGGKKAGGLGGGHKAEEDREGQREVVVSGGFDKRVCIWEIVDE